MSTTNGADPVAPSPDAPRLGDLPGVRILSASWLSTAAFTATAVGDRVGVDALELPATLTALALFAAGFVVWLIAFARAVGRSRTDEITLSGLFFLVGSAPRPIQVQLLGSLAVAVVVAGATASAAPFGVLEPVFPLALVGLWGARHGEFGPRRTPAERPRR
ncbi:MAG TPA: hypothetical protein VI916_02845 [Acidimicrobiia bacterium]|nr:hypothetical protein [Acidimicrobiia bacterium]